ncbi:MAG: helix-hairpin-helix domain-containing protein [Candidatus Promineifilaceae bacterium]
MTVLLILAGVVGLVIGVLAALYIDTQTLVRRVQEANAAKQKGQAELQKVQIQQRAITENLQIAQKELQTAVTERTQLEATIARQLQEIEASRQQLQTSIATNEVLKENLEEVQERLEELEGLRLMAEEKLQAAEAENGRLLSDLQLLEGEVVLQQEKADQLAQTAARLPELEQEVAAAEAALASLEAEKDTAVTQLQQAELAHAEQSARLATLEQKLAEAEAVRQQLGIAHEKLQTADTHLQKLQDKMEDVQTKLSYSGKNQLQLIRGIGPTYARRLNEFGIRTFAELAECEADQVAKIIKKKEWQAVDIQDWLDEAKALAASLNEDG